LRRVPHGVAVPDVETFHRLQAANRLAGFALLEGQVKQVQDTYLDTSERLILSAGYTYRQRELGQDEDVLITIKGLGGVEEAVHRREELEITLPAGAPPVEWPASPARDLVLQLIGEALLTPLFSLQQTRTVRQVNLGERPVAEWSLDQVHLIADGPGDKAQAYFELEVELASQGAEDDLAAIVTCLQDEWGLEPEPRSKFERALLFLEGTFAQDRLLTPQARAIFQQIATRNDMYSRRARALLALDEGVTQAEAGKRAGMAERTARYWLAAFRKKQLDIFPAHVFDQSSPATLPQTEAERPPEPLPLETLFDRYEVDRAHARAVADHAMALFDRLLPFHGLPPERRSLLETAALLHNVGLEADPDRHHIAGRDILLAHPPAELDDGERRVVALTTFLHRKRITPKKLDKLARQPLFADLPAPLQTQSLALAALVRMADGLDYSQTGSSQLEQVQQQEGMGVVEIKVVGPHAALDADRAQAKSDLWQLLFETALRFEAPRVKETLVPKVATLPTRPGLEADDSMAEAARKTFLFHFQRMLYHEPGTRLGEDIEELHDMRVATRRMRAALRVFGDYLDMGQMRPFVKGLRRTGRTLGAVRDMDVFWEKTQHYLDTLPPAQQSGLDSLRAVWEAEREQARGKMLAYLDSDRYIRFQEQFGEFLQTPAAGALPVISEQNEPLPHRLRHVVPVAVYRRMAAIRAYDEWVTGSAVPLERLHRLRIAAKRLRYTLEFFQEVLAPETRDLIKEMKKLQDHLGDLHDAVVASNLLRDFLTWGTWGHAQTKDGAPLPTEPVVAPGVAIYLAARQTELERLLDAFPQVWVYFQSFEFSQSVASAVASL